jgi:hypothetical protein
MLDGVIRVNTTRGIAATLDVQFQRIAAMQAQMDHLLATIRTRLALPVPTRIFSRLLLRRAGVCSGRLKEVVRQLKFRDFRFGC